MKQSVGRSGRARLAWGLGVLALAMQVACTSSSGGNEAQTIATRPASSASSPRVTAPAQIRSLTAVDRDAGLDIDIVADRALVWTTYRDVEGNLVVELPNSRPDTSVGNVARAGGLVSSVELALLEDADRPLTRLVVRTREESEHTLLTDGDTLRLQLVPAGYEPPPRAVAYEPLEDADEGREEVPVYAATDPAPSAAQPAAMPAQAGYGTPDVPMVGPAVTGVGATRLTGVEVLSSNDEQTTVLIRGDGEFAYASFRLESPDRFVLDLDGVVNTSLRSTVPVTSTNVDQIRIGQFKPRPDPVSRVVFDLETFTVPRIERSADGLTVRFGRAMEAPTETVTATLVEDVTTDDLDPIAPAPAVEEVVADTNAPALAEDSDSDVPPIAPQPTEPPVQVAAADPPAVETQEVPVYAADDPPVYAAADPEVTAPVEVVELAPVEPEEEVPVYQATPATVAAAPPTPPSLPRPQPVATDVAMFEAQQVQISQPAAPPAPQDPVLPPSFQSLVVTSSQVEYVGDPITMSLKNADLVETLRSFSRISDLNFVIQPGVNGSVTVELRGVPWDQALEQILKINNLGMDIDGTIVRIAPLALLQEEARAQRELEQLRRESVPLSTVMRTLSYADAQELADLLEGRGTFSRGGSTGRASLLSSRGSVQVDDRTNSLIIRELPEVIDTILTVIENLDTPEPQVKIEARIVEATRNFTRTLGIQWGFNGEASNRLGNSTGLEFPNNVTTDGGVNLLAGGNNGFLNLSLGNILNSFTLDAQLQAAENEGLINVVSAPSILTLNNTQATVQSGFQLPVQTVANNTVTSRFVNATLQLAVEPHVTAEGTILMRIRVAKREPNLSLLVPGSSNAPISTREASTRVIVRDGGTAVIGGIYEVTNNDNRARVPGLANVPIVGHLFKNRSRDSRNEELLIFVTPRIIRM